MIKILISVILLVLPTMNIFSQDTLTSTRGTYVINGTKKVVLDSVIVTNKQLENKIASFIKKNRNKSEQFVFIPFSGYKTIKTDTVVIELWMIDADFMDRIDSYNEEKLTFIYFDSTIVLLPLSFDEDKDSLFFKTSNIKKSFIMDNKEFISITSANNDTKYVVYAYYMSQRGKLRCKNGKRVFPLYYRNPNWIRTNILYRRQAKRYGYR